MPTSPAIPAMPPNPAAPPSYALPPGALPGFYVLVPHQGGYVYVPLSSSGWPLGLDGGAASMAPGPGTAAGTGFLRFDLEPPETRVIIDGSEVGSVASSGGAERGVTLPAGPHRVELIPPGLGPERRPPAFRVDIAPGQYHVFRWRPDTDSAITIGDGPADGYQVISPRATSPEHPVPSGGGGYFVVPKP